MATEATVVQVPTPYSFVAAAKLTAYVLDATGHQFSNTGREHVFLTSVAGGVALIASAVCSHSRSGDVTITLAAGESYCWPSIQEGFLTAGKVVLTLSSGTDVSMTVIRY